MPTHRNALWMNTLTWAPPARRPAQSGFREERLFGRRVLLHLGRSAQYKGQYAGRTFDLIDSVKQQVARHRDKLEFVATPAGIELAHREHKMAC